LYCAVDSSGATIDFLLSAKRDAAAAERFQSQSLGRCENHPAPRVINTDKHAGYPPAIAGLQVATTWKPDVLLIGTRSEVSLCLNAQEALKKQGMEARVISMPSWKLFEDQDEAYRDSVFVAAAIKQSNSAKG
jgi:transposase-like protein